MYLQLRSDLLNDKFSCTVEQALCLGALAVRVEYPEGRWLNESSTEYYFAPSVLRGPSRASLYTSLLREFSDVFELSRDQAKIQFIQVGVFNQSINQLIFTARCYAEHGYATVSRLSVCPSVTFRYHDRLTLF